MMTKQPPMEPRMYSGWILVERDNDADEVLWVAHCLDFDIVGWGNSIQSAITSVGEMLGVAICDDLAAGLDPHGRNRASGEEWNRLMHVMKNGQPVKISQVAPNAPVVLATQIVLTIEAREKCDDVIVPQPIPVDRLPSFQESAFAA